MNEDANMSVLAKLRSWGSWGGNTIKTCSLLLSLDKFCQFCQALCVWRDKYHEKGCHPHLKALGLLLEKLGKLAGGQPPHLQSMDDDQ